jgi:RNA polymerase sigma-54 factor
MLQVQYQSIRPATTAHLAQTMTLLALPVDALEEQIESELASNPALELSEERRCPQCKRLLPEHGPCSVCSRSASPDRDEPVVFVSPRDDFYPHSDAVGDDMPEEPMSPSVEDLPTFVFRQIASELDEKCRPMAAYLLTHLDEDGLLTTTLIEVATYLHVPLSTIKEVQSVIQHAEPLGVGSCSTQEALLVQLEVLSENHTLPEFTREIITKDMDLLSKRHFVELAHRYQTSMHQIQTVARFIGDNLNPFPARTHWGNERQPAMSDVQVYRQPDVIISYLNDSSVNSLVVEIILPIHGTLRVNPMYRAAIHQTTDDTKTEMKADLERASLFVKCLQQRNNTMQRLLQRVATIQKGFIVYGEKQLKPVTRAQLAGELGVHESTISRAVANKTVQLPNKRIIPMASFFDRSLNVRTVIKDLINGENAPLSDSDIVIILAKQGFDVARRTVAKYRAMEGILPAHLRRIST